MIKQLLLLFIGYGCIAITFGQRLPTRRLMAPSLQFAESFERFDDEEEDSTQSAGEELRELLGQQFTSAVAPLTAVPFLSLTRRQPGIVAPRSGAEAALRFADSGDSDFGQEQESSEEDSDEPESETEADTDTDTAQPEVPVSQPEPEPQPEPQPESESQSDYNPYRDNFNDQNADGSYVYGYSLPNGVRRWERGFHSEQQHGLVVEGFYAEPRQFSKGVQYELRCYRADSRGYQPLAVEYLPQPPRVRRFELPNLPCFNANRLRL